MYLRVIGKIEGLLSSRPGDDEGVGDRFAGRNLHIEQHGISMSAQIRDMIRDRMESRSLYVETRPRTRPLWSKQTDRKYIPALNEELKAVFARMREKAASQQEF